MWVASIQTYAKGDNGFPKIVVIGTHKDKLPVSKSIGKYSNYWTFVYTIINEYQVWNVLS